MLERGPSVPDARLLTLVSLLIQIFSLTSASTNLYLLSDLSLSDAQRAASLLRSQYDLLHIGRNLEQYQSELGYRIKQLSDFKLIASDALTSIKQTTTRQYVYIRNAHHFTYPFWISARKISNLSVFYERPFDKNSDAFYPAAPLNAGAFLELTAAKFASILRTRDLLELLTNTRPIDMTTDPLYLSRTRRAISSYAAHQLFNTTIMTAQFISNEEDAALRVEAAIQLPSLDETTNAMTPDFLYPSLSSVVFSSSPSPPPHDPVPVPTLAPTLPLQPTAQEGTPNDSLVDRAVTHNSQPGSTARPIQNASQTTRAPQPTAAHQVHKPPLSPADLGVNPTRYAMDAALGVAGGIAICLIGMIIYAIKIIYCITKVAPSADTTPSDPLLTPSAIRAASITHPGFVFLPMQTVQYDIPHPIPRSLPPTPEPVYSEPDV